MILNGRQGTFNSDVWYCKISVFSFMDVLLIFLKYRRSVSFPIIVISAFTGFVFCLCQDLSCLMTGSRFWHFWSSSSVSFSVVGGKLFSISVFERGILSSVSYRLKT